MFWKMFWPVAVVASILILAAPSFAAEASKETPKENVSRAPSLGVIARHYPKEFNQEACVKHAVHIANKFNKKLDNVGSVTPTEAGVFLNDSEISMNIMCFADADSVIFIIGSTKYKYAELQPFIRVIQNLFDEKDWIK